MPSEARKRGSGEYYNTKPAYQTSYTQSYDSTYYNTNTNQREQDYTVNNTIGEQQGERGLGTVGAATGGMIGHHEGKQNGHRFLGTIGGMAAGALVGKMAGNMMGGGHNHHQGLSAHGYPAYKRSEKTGVWRRTT
jgi:hypothetical protein